jgi:hypothetical protein
MAPGKLEVPPEEKEDDGPRGKTPGFRNLGLCCTLGAMKARLRIGIVSLIMAASAWGRPPAPTKTLEVELRTNERELYPVREDAAVVSLERLPDGLGVRLVLRSDRKDFSHFVYKLGDGAPAESRDGALEIRFRDDRRPEVQQARLSVRALDRQGGSSPERGLALNFYPRELYAASGRTEPGYIIVQQSDIPWAASRIEDWIVDVPAPDDLHFALKRWGGKLAGAATPYEKARRLARALLDDLTPRRGTPSDKMDVPPFEQYRRATGGGDRVWCGNLAAIFVRAATSLGIPARMIGMHRYLSKEPAPAVLLAEGHATTEIFDEIANRWFWIDLTFSMTGMELEGYGGLTMAELYRFLNDPGKAPGLFAWKYDPGSRTEKHVRVLESPDRDALLNYFKKDQTFRYSRIGD